MYISFSISQGYQSESSFYQMIAELDESRYYHVKRGYLGPAATLPEHQGKGLAKALTARAMNFLRERGFEQISLYTWEGNPAALKVTYSLGFRISHAWKLLSKTLAEAHRERC